MPARSNTLLVLAAALVAAVVGAEPPDLGGRWTLAVDSPGSSEGAARPRIPATAGGGWGREITITLEAQRVTIERHQFVANDMQPPMRYVYALGGPESRHVVNMGLGPQEQVARASIDGDTLVIVSRYAEGTSLAAEVKQIFSIDASRELVVATTRKAGTAMSTATARYRRQP